MSVTQYPKLRSDKARIDRLTEALAQWEANLRSFPVLDSNTTFTFAEAQDWAHGTQLDMIAEIQTMIAR